MKVTIKGRKGSSILVEYVDADGLPKRKYMATSDILSESGSMAEISEEAWELAIPFGISWEEVLPDTFTINSVDIARNLYNNGIYTEEGYKADPSGVLNVIMATCRTIIRNMNSIISGGRND